MNARTIFRFDASRLGDLLDGIAERGYRLLGPVAREGAVVYDELGGADDLPRGWRDHQDPGRYRLERSDRNLFFEFNMGPHGWKKYLLPAEEPLWRALWRGEEMLFEETNVDDGKRAFIGVRACELAALAMLDRVFGEGDFRDDRYLARRANLFIVAVNCTRAGRTCFCTSMDTGPEARSGFDLVLTEVAHGGAHFFQVAAGTTRGDALLDALAFEEASPADRNLAKRLLDEAARSMGRHLNTGGLPERLAGSGEHPHWQRIAARCLACANCTMVCPTCFCNTVVDRPALDGRSAERIRCWDSCFSADFSYLHGGSIRQSTGSRYRQWMTHKLSSWVDQFGASGCVGCGRCIAWCPVGIDITEEAERIGEELS
ncbi:4Fe-4S dicluster domain-containing protein [Sulfidibacter corallicola]|uniref:4Fe-4S dicluster domain-containing protein n=1 Tax=Sulfidibacter corallicola TaxID=2818388 RepID=A0A8A4TWZ3_SULCO|nr:4Fe-4S dicluster domain-containing protein [Sulfidibacter corallicola]QTD53644.1 4Fe-4S dicluster domain-containing protein [Sulfidibacter corallicola]